MQEITINKRTLPSKQTILGHYQFVSDTQLEWRFADVSMVARFYMLSSGSNKAQ